MRRPALPRPAPRRALAWAGAAALAAAVAVAPAAAHAAHGDAAGGGASPGASTPAPTGGGRSPGGASLDAVTPGPRPTAPLFHLNPGTIVLGNAVPRLSLRVVQPASRTVRASVRIVGPHGSAVTMRLGAVRTGQVLRFRLPKALPIVAGTYRLRLSVTDHVGQTLAVSRRGTGTATLRVKPKPRPQPKAPAAITPDPTTPKAAPAPKPKPKANAKPKPKVITVAFPVAGPHAFGDRFGVGRVGHRHQGQDVVAAAGLPVVAPAAGTVEATGYQAAAAGYWVEMHTPGGRDFFFAHCQKRSTAVHSGEAVGPGTRLCRVGQTGDATGPHLHFEIWLDGWRTSSASHPIDPLPQLERWQAADPRW